MKEFAKKSLALLLAACFMPIRLPAFVLAEAAYPVMIPVENKDQIKYLEIHFTS